MTVDRRMTAVFIRSMSHFKVSEKSILPIAKETKS